MFFFDEIQKILAQFFFVDLVGGFSIVPGQLAYRQQVSFLGSGRKTVQLHVLDHLLP
jgi:hypothetical protein